MGVLCRAQPLTDAHRVIGTAAALGICFFISHTVTFIVTCAGPGWETTALCLDLMGWIAGGCFSILCWKSSNTDATVFRKNNVWICIWSCITVGVRILDTLMLFGVVRLSAVYTAPTGAVLGTNIVSDVLFGNLFTIAALVGSLMLLLHPKHIQENDGEIHLIGD